MATIGTFTKSENGFTGTVKTLSLNVKTVKFVPAEGDSERGRHVSSGSRVDLSRGERVSRVSSEWFSRPDDERYLSLTDLYDAVRRRAECAQARTVESRAVKVETACDHAERLALLVPGRDEPVAPTQGGAGAGRRP
jgi:uncharacterized protein (DUF736 family)